MIKLEQFEGRNILERTGRDERKNLPGELALEIGLRATMIQDAIHEKHNLKDATNAEKWADIEIDAIPFPISKVREILNEEIEIEGKMVKKNGAASQFFTGPMLKMFDFDK
jgi:hypothetical protein